MSTIRIKEQVSPPSTPPSGDLRIFVDQTTKQLASKDDSGAVKLYGGDVVGPAGATDKAVSRYDATTGKIIQDSLVTVDDNGNIATPGTVDGRDVSVDGAKLDGIPAGALPGDVVGPASATDNALARFDGATGKLIKDSSGLKYDGNKLDVTGNIKSTGFMDFGILSSVPDQEGRVYYDTEEKSLSLKTDIAGSTQSLGQEFWIRVINKTGVSIPDGSVVRIDGFDVTSGRPTIALAKADIIATSNAIGFTTNTMADDAEGFVTALGFLNDLDTSAFSAGDELFLSNTVAGSITAIKPLIPIPVGFATKINASTGQILTAISRKTEDSPFFAQLSDSTNQKPSVTTPVVIKFNTNDDIRGLTHGTSLATEDIIINFDGTYTVIAQPQIEKTMGGGTEFFHMWARIGPDDKGGVTAVSVANPSQISTDAPHGLSTGQTVDLTDLNTTPDINGQQVVTVTGANTFTIPVNVTVVTDGVGNWRRILDVNDDLANSNVELKLTGATDSSVIPLIFTRDFAKGEKLNLMQSVETAGLGIGLVASTPAGEPAIPSIILVMNKN